ncbi:MAG TPA: V-type ATPase subunit, partial [Vicinamibacteria bacterium]|nr:V-type ATPase subunit [Vicinamibacteria bacterium]
AMSGVRWRGRELREIAWETIDLENALAAIVVSRHASGVEPEICFIEGGRRLGIERFSEAARSGNLEPLAGAFAATPFARIFRESGRSLSDIELVLFRERLRSYVSRARREPLSVVTIFAHVLRVRAEAIDLRQLAWSLAFGASPTAQDLVSVR